MKVIIAGARDLTQNTHYEGVVQAVEQSGFDVSEVVSGGASGIDELGQIYAKEYNLDLTVFYANWKKRGKAAGPHRNSRMASYADALIALPGPDSKGTYHMIKEAKSKGLQVFVARYFCG